MKKTEIEVIGLCFFKIQTSEFRSQFSASSSTAPGI